MSEKNEIKRDNASAQKNSGRGKYQKGDALWHQFVVDYKEASKSFSLNKNVWSKICTDAFRVDSKKHPALKIIIGEGNNKVRLAIIEWDVLDELIKEIDEHS